MRFNSLLATPVSGGSLAVFRVAVGLIMALEIYTLCRPSVSTSGTIPLETYYTGTDIKFHFPYAAFAWLPVLPAPWIRGLVLLQALAGCTMAAGLFYRASAATVFLTWGYLFAVESTRTYWQSYHYLELLITFLMIWMPAARRFSVDAWLARRQHSTRLVPSWAVLLLRGQLVVAYFYGGVAKLNADWLLDAAPLRWDLRESHVTAPFAAHLSPAHFELFKAVVHSPQFAYFLCYAGAIFDLAIGFLLLVRRTRILGILLMAIFHATNHFLIYDNIDWFPLLGFTSALIFLDPDWPERFWNWLRRPRVARPDWAWLVGGAVLLPVVGASLGWKLAPSSPATPKPAARLRGSVPPFVVGWLVIQALLPIRHYFIPGDGRFTYEGLSFSWRLKADDHRARGVHLFVKDPVIVPSNGDSGASGARINWNEWHGEKVVYRNVTPGQINWARLPEIVAVLEPTTGERIIFNPYASPTALRTEAECRERVRVIWQDLYQREPKIVGRTLDVSEVLDSLAAALRGGGNDQEGGMLAAMAARMKQLAPNQGQTAAALKMRAETLAMVGALRRRDPNGGMIPFLLPLNPFVLEGESQAPGRFLVIEDPPLFDPSQKQWRQISRASWKSGSYTASQSFRPAGEPGGEPMIVHLGSVGSEARQLLPQSCLFDYQDRPNQAPVIWWNCLKDLTPSKFMHISNQPFFLRRYARRVAGLWEQSYGRRPAVVASTAVSLNGRPYQPLVNPDVDLAAVPLTRFGHNAWIRDLEMPRIPREALSGDRPN